MHRLLKAPMVRKEFNEEYDTLARAAATSGTNALTSTAEVKHLHQQSNAMLSLVVS